MGALAVVVALFAPLSLAVVAITVSSALWIATMLLTRHVVQTVTGLHRELAVISATADALPGPATPA